MNINRTRGLNKARIITLISPNVVIKHQIKRWQKIYVRFFIQHLSISYCTVTASRNTEACVRFTPGSVTYGLFLPTRKNNIKNGLTGC